jgi:putative oxidoreductase
MNSRPKNACRFVLGAVFLLAGAMKLAHPADFFADLLSYRVPFPEMFLRIGAVFLPWLEVLTGIGLLLNVWAETVRPVVSGLCLIFVVMLGQAVLRGLDLNCGCFGAVGRGWFERPDVALLRAGLLFAASLYVAAILSARPADPVS